MCGIYGILSLRDGKNPDPALLESMAEKTIHRGPDDEGSYVGEGVILGMRRLSIIDVGGGHQPIASEDGKLQVVCNGEIYNFRQLREGLLKKGHVFRTKSDSEVVLHLYEEHGDSCIRQLEGMFAFALWDSHERRLLLGRDRLGIKPIYYHSSPERLAFASELKALLAVPGVPTDLDPVALEQYLALGYVPGPYSMVADVRKLPVASLMTCERGRVHIDTYWHPPRSVDRSLREQDWLHATREQLERSVVSQMVSDVPIGAFLSGGIDSSAVVAFMSRHSDRPVKTYSIGFSEESSGHYFNELDYARNVARLFKTEHQEIIVRPDVSSLLPRLLWSLDEPIADSAFITTYLVAEFARRDVKVILSGVGGDELFGGYRRYLGEHYSRWLKLVPHWVREKILVPIGGRLPGDRHSTFLNFSRYAGSFLRSCALPFQERYRSYVQVFAPEQRRRLLGEGMPQSPYDAMSAAFGQAHNEDMLNQLCEVDLSTQLPDDLLLLTDRMTMATSLECRVPLLDEALVDLSLRMPGELKVRGGTLKYVLKKALADVLPPRILHRSKRGFGAPMGAWMKKELSPLLKSVLSKKSVESRGIFDWETIRETMASHDANRQDNTDHLLALMNLEIWCRLYLDGQSPDEVSSEMLCKAKELAGSKGGIH